MSGICDTCRREPCNMRFDGCKTCDIYEGGETRYERLFGTPERAARTLLRNGKSVPACYACLVRDECSNLPEDSECPMNGYDALLELLRGDA